MAIYRLKSWFFQNRMKLAAFYLIKCYQFSHWFLRWGVDSEGDIVLSIAGILHFVKYKESTITYFGPKKYDPARKYVKARRDE